MPHRHLLKQWDCLNPLQPDRPLSRPVPSCRKEPRWLYSISLPNKQWVSQTILKNTDGWWLTSCEKISDSWADSCNNEQRSLVSTHMRGRLLLSYARMAGRLAPPTPQQAERCLPQRAAGGPGQHLRNESL